MLTLFAFSLSAYFFKHIVFIRTRKFNKTPISLPPSFFTLSFWFRFMSPFWYPRNIKTIKHLSYASIEETNTASEEDLKYWNLEILHYTSLNQHSKHPVLLYIHSGNHNEPTPTFLSYLILKQYVVVKMNYRFCNKSTFLDKLTDIKRAIRWTKLNIGKFGGDAEKLFVSGGDIGGYLAIVAGMTVNQSRYQKGFEDHDTSFQGCIIINGLYETKDIISRVHLGSDLEIDDVSPISIMNTLVKKEKELRESTTTSLKSFNSFDSISLSTTLPPILVFNF